MRTIVLLLFTFASQSFAFDHTHKIFNELLERNCIHHEFSTQVRYENIKNNEVKNLDRYLKELSQVTKDEYNTFNRDQRLSFLINAYNAFTLKLIVDNYPLKSIKEIGGLFSSPWKKKFIFLLGEKIDLDTIEHLLIRKAFNEPRIHFVLVCAAKGCPPLNPVALTAENLEFYLTKSTRNFLKDAQKNYYNYKRKRLTLSPIFDWYKEDFEKDGVDLVDWLIPFLEDLKLVEALKREDIEIRYSVYDWSLNDVN